MKSGLVKYGVLLILVGLLFVAAFNQNNIGPSSSEIIDQTTHNTQIVNQYGAARSAQLLNIIGSKRIVSYSFSSKESVWSGTSFVDLVGEKKSGRVKVTWEKDGENPLSILSTEEVINTSAH